MEKIYLLDLNYTLVGNQAATKPLRPFSRRLAAEEYRADLIEAIRGDHVILITARPDRQFLLMAFSKLSEDGLAEMTYSECRGCLDLLWDQIDIYHGSQSVCSNPWFGLATTKSLFLKKVTAQRVSDNKILLVHILSIRFYRIRANLIRFS